MSTKADRYRLTKEQIEVFTETFLLFDINGNGHISSEELENVMRSLGIKPTKAELQDIINEVDADGDGSVSLSEFLAMMRRKMEETEGMAVDKCREVFKVFDKDNSGTICAGSLSC